ncbi:MAG TPA: class I SAM-dependent methyltransferase [Chitinophagales bacterium]|nr:class I SAM-dependent methyltransferase [Chitinophagales bacterium]
MEELQACPCCTSKNFKHNIEVKDYYVSQETFSIALCNDCGFQFTNPRPEVDKIGKYYDSVNYISHHSNNDSLFHKAYRFIRNIMTKKKLNTLRQYVHKESADLSLLDYGAASGDFLAACQLNNITKVIGIEQDETCRNNAKLNYNLDIKSPKELMDIQAESVDIITLWHVLEHVHNIDETLLHFHRILDKNGVLAISVPNIISYDSIYYKQFWSAIDVPRHIYHFEPKTIEILMQRLGFQLMGTMKMPFDSYYISLHSEYYQKRSGIMAIIRAIVIGFISNWKARKTNNYSSLTYFFKIKKV